MSGVTFNQLIKTIEDALAVVARKGKDKFDITLMKVELELSVSAMLDTNGKYIGPMITWEVVTEKVATEKREAETADVLTGGFHMEVTPPITRT